MKKLRRTSIPNRKKLTEVLVEEQHNKCFYCGIPFGTPYDIRESNMWVTKWTKPILDHFIPWSYLERHEENLFVASCEICNHLKSDTFPDEDIVTRVRKRFNKKLENGTLRILMRDLPESIKLGIETKKTKVPKDK